MSYVIEWCKVDRVEDELAWCLHVPPPNKNERFNKWRYHNKSEAYFCLNYFKELVNNVNEKEGWPKMAFRLKEELE